VPNVHAPPAGLNRAAAAADHPGVTLVLLILLAAWLCATLLVVSLCRVARQGDEAQGAHMQRIVRHREPARRRRAHRPRVGAARR
jgi:hypothetical protein